MSDMFDVILVRESHGSRSERKYLIEQGIGSLSDGDQATLVAKSGTVLLGRNRVRIWSPSLEPRPS